LFFHSRICANTSTFEPSLRHAGRKLGSNIEVFAQIREWKNNF